MKSDQNLRNRKLIEVALPLETINRESAREKSIRHGHPSTLHLWWARRPLAAARAVLFAQLVDDPASNPEKFPTDELQRKERDRLHRLIERLAVWENARDPKLLAEAHDEILKSCGGKPPTVLDPFAGGGTIPLEAHRLGLEVRASDLNPVAVLINKALVELPPKFRDKIPIFPGLAESEIRSWRGPEGLAADVKAYGTWIFDKANQQLSASYPSVQLDDGAKATVMSWIWARTIKCPNPGCGIEMPLVRSWWLSKKKGNETYIAPEIVPDSTHPSSRRARFRIVSGSAGKSSAPIGGTVLGRTGAVCIACQGMAPLSYIRTEGMAGRIGQTLIAIVAEGPRRRVYLEPLDEHIKAALVTPPDNAIVGEIADNPRWFSPPAYGLATFADLFTNRQLLALVTFSDLIAAAHQQVQADGGDPDYADAIATYLAMVLSKVADRGSSMVTWVIERASTRNTFARQAIPMAWDFVEANQLSSGTGSWLGALDWTCESIGGLYVGDTKAVVLQDDARDAVAYPGVIATDPPYYDNIGYSDLSDFFYVWLRRSLRGIYPDLFRTVLVPKAEELVANPYRHNGKEGAKQFFEEGFRTVFATAKEHAVSGYPISVWYAFKQSETSDDGKTSSGWETLLEGMIHSGWEITSTWPMSGERGGRTISLDTNALASAIVLTLRPRKADAPTTDLRGFIGALTAELPDALRRLQQGQIAPVDLPQATIGPGMAVFSRFRAVLEPDGSLMSVRSALARINEILDEVLNEQEGDFDASSRFAIAWYRQHGYGTGKFGDADKLARARNTSVDVMSRDGILTSRAGIVQLLSPDNLSSDYDVTADLHTSNWEVLHHLVKVLERDGIAPAGEFLRTALSRIDSRIEADLLKELAHLLFRIAEDRGWTRDAIGFNNLVTSWPQILELARSNGTAMSTQSAFDFEDGD